MISPINIGNHSGSDQDQVGFSEYENDISHNRLARIDEDPNPGIESIPQEQEEDDLMHMQTEQSRLGVAVPAIAVGALSQRSTSKQEMALIVET